GAALHRPQRRADLGADRRGDGVPITAGVPAALHAAGGTTGRRLVSHTSPTDLLVLHAVRIRGFADTAAIAHRFGFDAVDTEEHLLDAEARGWVTFSAFGGTGGWSLTERGRAENERRLACELAGVDGAQVVRDVY